MGKSVYAQFDSVDSAEKAARVIREYLGEKGIERISISSRRDHMGKEAKMVVYSGGNVDNRTRASLNPVPIYSGGILMGNNRAGGNNGFNEPAVRREALLAVELTGDSAADVVNILRNQGGLGVTVY